ncbi:signal transduction histidine kinase regulating citrate/malate metabolism [Alkaliphilus metalliredigens QYMF]|uniref:Signal transduction histidine kinase regulating citrate/malate metabolism n=1 Tax=Alkaliphilus metalliredigens (strain QYMF) TaxID=293826 RepID=A6TJH7_ALKMQ|nr:GHKL domain-containing protein [Alkaliphilus metalliredigens]ABR46345.1 signal transduction histidine kinase regulating citrate/malate metabolism [Alkaliphilus metalliredigens QYMF]
MQWYEIFILSILETVSILIVWSKLNRKVNVFSKKGAFIVIIISIIAVLFFIYETDIGFAINFFILCTTIIFLFNVAIKETILQFFIVLSIMISIQLTFTYILYWVTESMVFSFNNGVVVNIGIIVVSALIYKFIIFDEIYKYLVRYRNYIIIIMINISGAVLLLIYIWQINKEFITSYIAYLLLAVFIWEALNLYFLYQSIRIREQQKVIDIHEKYTPFLKSMVQEVRQKQHDFKNHLNVLYGLIQIQDSGQVNMEIKEYIEKLIENIKSTDKLLNIKDQVLSAIIYSKKVLADEKNICFDVEFISQIPVYPLEKYELVELFGNLLDNAIEAAETRKDEYPPKVVLILGIEGDFKVVEIKNTGGTLQNEEIGKIFHRGFSTKKGKHRGYGLYNVKKIVSRHSGTIELSFDDDYTIFKIKF